jgi:hypothetical protein
MGAWAGATATVSDDELERAAQEIESASAPLVLLIVTAGKISVYAYRER